MSDYVRKSEFAAILGVSRAYVTQLVAAGRLVLSDDGTRVHVEASLDRMGATADPSKAGVRERWAAHRAAAAAAAGPAPTAAPIAAAAAPAAAPAPAPAVAPAPLAEQPSLIDEPAAAPASPAAAQTPAPVRSEYQDARARREQAEAELAQIRLLEARGKVLDADSTLRAITTANITVCTELLGLSDRLTPLVVGQTDKRRVWELINAECERLAQRVQQSVQQLAQQQRVEVSA